MKVEQIDLKAYGHFTNKRLALGGSSGFHIICGPNEAGKTTLWRAINGALFGIPETTQDGFLHEMKKLRIGLSLTARSGERLSVMRRKGRVNTLLKYEPPTGDELSDSVPEELLREWLGGLSQGLFLAMFSLDHDALVRGGKALAQGKGDAGESIFEAGAGLTSIRALRAKLDREAETLFKPRASTSAIYKTLSEYEETRKQAKDAAIRPAEWTSSKSAMDATSKAYEAAKAEQAQLQKEARRLERLAAILPDVAALALAQHRLTELASVPVLPPSASIERVAAVTKKDEAISSERSGTLRQRQHQSELDAIRINDAVLVDAESIEAIHHATAMYRDASIQSAKAEAATKAAQSAFDSVLKQIAADELPADPLQWIPDPTRVAKIRALITSGATLKATHHANLKTLREKKLEVEQLDEEIRILGQDDGSEDLGSYLDSIADHGDPQARAQQLEDEAKAAQTKLDTEASTLKLPSADAVAKTTVPLDAEAQLFKSEDEELRRRSRSIREDIEKVENDLATLRGDIKGLEIRGDVPTKEAVSVERETRNALWLGIRRHFMPAAGESVPADPPPPAERYEHAVTSADDAADGLFADAEGASRYAEFRVRESQMQSTLNLGKGREAAVAKEQVELNKRWTELLAGHGLPSIKITEAAQWIAKRESFLQRFDANQTKREESQQRRKLAQEIRTRITDIFRLMKLPDPAVSERLSETLARARAVAKQTADQLTERQLKKTARANAEVARKHAEEAESTSRVNLDEWETQWADAMMGIRLASAATVEEATARLEQFSGLAQAHDALERARTERRHATIQIGDYESRLGKTWQRVRNETIPADGRAHDILASELYRELTSTRVQQEKKSTLTQQVVDDQQAVNEALQAAEDATRIIDKLLLRAGCITVENLELVEGQSAQRVALEDEIRQIEARLVKSAGLPLAEALGQAQGQDPDAIAEALVENLQKNDSSASEVQKFHENYIATRQTFEKMDGSAAAADAQQKTAQHASRIAELGADYAASRVASAVLAQVIDIYQKRNQGPLIKQASERFAAITGGRYSSVVIDYDEEKQILKAVRSNGERLTMEQLSTGRRDQLFLALRLAAIEGHLENGEPLPVIVDDILIQFDDEAAAATFKVLADLSQRTQVLFLTHHEHLLDVAAAAIGAGAYESHMLSF
jgi:uncharacterized protein YhaN